MSSALSETIWMELRSFLASWSFWLSCRTWVEFSWQNLVWAWSSTSSVFPKSSSSSCCIFWYCSCTSSFRCCTFSCNIQSNILNKQNICLLANMAVFIGKWFKRNCHIHMDFTHGLSGKQGIEDILECWKVLKRKHTSTRHLSDSSL